MTKARSESATTWTRLCRKRLEPPQVVHLRQLLMACGCRSVEPPFGYEELGYYGGDKEKPVYRRAELPAGWPPGDWTDDWTPIDGGAESILAWLQYNLKHLPHTKGRLHLSQDCTSEVENAYCLVRHLYEHGWKNPPTKPKGEFNTSDALSELVRVLDWVEAALAAEQPTVEEKAEPADKPATVQRKQSTAKGEARVKLIGALTEWHKYADGGCLNPAPVGNNELARKAKVSESTASVFINKEFEGYTKYRAICGDTTKLVAALKLLNQEFSPHLLFGTNPPEKGKREDVRESDD